MKTWKKRNLLLGVFLLFCLGCPAAWAHGNEATVLETVIVTDSGRKTKLLETNAAIHVITAKDIMNSGQSSTADLISSIPGVVNQKSSSQTYFSIRGTRSGMSGGPRIYVDGRPINTGVYGYSKIDSIPLDSIERIEVLKSPSTAKYGGNAGRGVILITTKRGSDSKEPFSGLVFTEYGSWQTLKANASISGALDRTDYALSAYAKQSDGYRNDDKEVKSLDGQLGWRFDGGRIDWITGYNQSFNKYPAGLTYWQLEQDKTVNYGNSKADGSGYLIPPNESDEDLFNTILRLDYDKNNWLINGSAGFSRDHQDFFYDKYLNSGSKLDDNYREDRLEKIYDLKTTVGRVFNGTRVSQTFSLGADIGFSDYDQDRIYPYDTAGNNTASEQKADIEAQKQLRGINVNHDIEWELFRLQSGLRFNYVSYDLSNRLGQSVDVSYENDVDWSISPSVNVLDNANLFATWNRSNYYLPLGYYTSNMSYDDPNTRPGDLVPEIYNTLETGWKHQVNKGFNYSFIVYWTRITDKIVSYYNEDGDFAGRHNVGTSIHKGIEAEVDGRPLDWLGYRISFTTIDAEWDQGTAKAYETPGSNYGVTDLSGRDVNYVPGYEYTLGLDFYPVRNSRYGSLTIALDLRGFGRQYEDYNNNLEMGAASFLDAKVTWAYRDVEWYVACTNLFDREWDRLVNASGNAHSKLTSGFFPQDGRYIGFGLAYRF